MAKDERAVEVEGMRIGENVFGIAGLCLWLMPRPGLLNDSPSSEEPQLDKPGNVRRFSNICTDMRLSRGSIGSIGGSTSLVRRFERLGGYDLFQPVFDSLNFFVDEICLDLKDVCYHLATHNWGICKNHIVC